MVHSPVPNFGVGAGSEMICYLKMIKITNSPSLSSQMLVPLVHVTKFTFNGTRQLYY